MYYRPPTWALWLATVERRLRGGEQVAAPSNLPDPREAGFRLLSLAEPVGQIADFAMSLADGSRYHIHQFADGRRVVHRDEYDPDRSFAHAFGHFVSETKTGKIGLVAVGVAGVALLVHLFTKKR